MSICMKKTRMSFDRACAPSALVLALYLSSSAVAIAQVLPNAGSTLRESQQSAPALPMPATGTIQLPAEPQAPVLTVDSIRFQVQAFRITGNQSIDSALLLPLVQDVTGAERSLSELEAAAERITSYYRKHGYLVARAYIPVQDIRNGVVEIAVLEGHYDKVRLENQSGFSDAILQRYLTPQQLGETVGANLQAGAVPGTTDLTVKVGAAPRVYARLEADNYGVRNTGRNRFGGAVQWNNPTGNADRLDARVFTTADGQDYARLGYSIAVGGDGLRLGLAYVESRYQVGGNFASLDAYGRAGVWSATASYPLRRSRDFNLNLEAGLDQKSLQDNVGAFASSTRKTNQVAGLGLSGDVRNRIGSSEGTTTFSVRAESGQLDIETPLARDIDDLSARTNGAYQRYTYALAQYQWLSNSTMLLLSVNGQQASKNLDSAEKMSLGGPFAVRAYPSGEASGDQGYVATAEIRHTLDQQLLPGQLMLSGFIDSGMVKTNAQPFIQGDNQRRLSGAGVGVSFAMPNRLELRLVYAHKIGSEPARSDSDRSGRLWGMLALTF
jgi:hemolysin activation/secretion protein